MFLKLLLMCVATFGFGVLSSGGVFTVFVSVGLVPRFADKTHTADHILHYENAIVAGSLCGCLFSIYREVWASLLVRTGIMEWFNKRLFYWEAMAGKGFFGGDIFLTVFGLFSGMFVGCFAIAIAEILNTIPVSVRRIGLGQGSGIVILAIALGKTVGALLYYIMGM